MRVFKHQDDNVLHRIGCAHVDFAREREHQHLRFSRSQMEVSDGEHSEAAIHG